MAAWRKSTRAKYTVYLNKWFKFASQRNINPLSTKYSNIITFFTKLYKDGLGYSAINTARSAINQFISICSGTDYGSCKILNRFMKGIFELRPALPKYDRIWDVQKVLDYLEQLPPDLTLIRLSEKLAVLFLLLTAQRCQTLHLMTLEDISFEDDSLIIKFNHLLKQTKPGRHLKPLILKGYYRNRNICIVTVFKEYLERTKYLRTGDKLLISTQKPHKHMAKCTLSRWIRNCLQKAGVLGHYAPHSIRSAAARRAASRGIPLKDLLKTAGWSNALTFAKFYNKEIETETRNSVQLCLLHTS